ncbi:MAG TPA: hypothetical protein VF131_22915 [Blastocatellia bacterium]|nr:hypothetical protein [Blastocatellia bacterium]
MSIKVASNRFITSSLKGWFGFYQQLISNVSSFQELGSALVKEADIARGFRQSDRMEELGLILSNIPIKEYNLIGQYYLGWASYLKGENPRAMFEQVAEYSKTYKAKAFVALAAIEARKGDYSSEIKCFKEALRCVTNISTAVEVLRAIAIVKAKEGFHPQSLKDLESILPLARYADMRAYHDYLNSLAVELIEVGRLEEARNISNIVLASPYVFAYPEWRETGEEIRLKLYRSRSTISFSRVAPHNVVQLPERSSETKFAESPAKLLYYTDWIKKMVKEPNGDKTDDTSLDEMTNKDLIIEIVQRTSNKDMSEKKLRKILEYVMEVESEPED